MRKKNRMGLLLAVALSICLMFTLIARAVLTTRQLNPGLEPSLMIIAFLPAFFVGILCVFLCLGRRWARILLLFLCGLSLVTTVLLPFARVGLSEPDYGTLALNLLFFIGITAVLGFAHPLVEHTG